MRLGRADRGEAWAPDLFTSQVYQEVVAGKPRHNGALAALEYFAVPDEPALVDEYAERKQQKVIAPIEAGEFKAFPDGVRLLLDAHTAGVRVAAASSSKNANLMLGKLRLDELADEHGMAHDWIEPLFRRQGRRLRRDGGDRPAAWRPWALRASTTLSSLRTPAPTSWSQRSTIQIEVHSVTAAWHASPRSFANAPHPREPRPIRRGPDART